MSISHQIFDFTSSEKIFWKCVFSSVCHAVMTGQYTLLSGEIGWDGKKYLFQNMENIRGVISFEGNVFLCGIQNIEDYIGGRENIEKMLLTGAGDEVVTQAREEVFPYLLIEEEETAIPAVSAVCWRSSEKILSAVSENEFMAKSDRAMLPFLYEDHDVKIYWRDYYEMSGAQEKLVQDIFEKMLAGSAPWLSPEQENQLISWYGENAKHCRELLDEIPVSKRKGMTKADH
jgi:hypothetical protein